METKQSVPRLNVHPHTMRLVERALHRARIQAEKRGDPPPNRQQVIHELLRAGYDASRD